MTRIRSAVLALLVLACASPVLAQPAYVTTSMGMMDLEFDPAVWRISQEPAGATIACIAGAECGNARIDVLFTMTDARCDERSAYESARQAFPWATRHATNMHVVDRLALYFGSADDGYDPEHRDAVYACVNAGGVLHEFISRIGRDPLPPFHPGSVFELLSGLKAPPQAFATLPVAGLTLTYPEDVWEVARAVPDDGIWTLSCIPPTCEGDAAVDVSAVAVPLVGPCGASLIPPGDFEGDTRPLPVPEGLSVPFTATEAQSMCRAMSPPAYDACVVVDGVRYMLSTGTVGCNFGGSVPESAFIHLLGMFAAP